MFKEISTMIELTSDHNLRIMSPRVIYNEDYLLRLIMFWFMQQNHFIVNSDLDRKICKAFQLADERARSYTYATIETPFKVRKKGEKDPLAEASSQVSGVNGHFTVLYGKKKERVVLLKDAKQFIVLEVTLNKPLKKGTKKFKNYNQIARDVACMIQTLSHLENPFLDNLGLFVVAPEKVLEMEIFKTYTYKPNIEELITNRIKAYGDNEDKKALLELFQRLFQRIDVDCLAYEDIIRFITKNDSHYGERINGFYSQCLKYHGIE